MCTRSGTENTVTPPTYRKDSERHLVTISESKWIQSDTGAVWECWREYTHSSASMALTMLSCLPTGPRGKESGQEASRVLFVSWTLMAQVCLIYGNPQHFTCQFAYLSQCVLGLNKLTSNRVTNFQSFQTANSLSQFHFWRFGLWTTTVVHKGFILRIHLNLSSEMWAFWLPINETEYFTTNAIHTSIKTEINLEQWFSICGLWPLWESNDHFLGVTWDH